MTASYICYLLSIVGVELAAALLSAMEGQR